MRLVLGFLASSIHFHIRGNERSQEPRPNSSLVVSSIALCGTASVSSAVLWIARCETAKPKRGQQMIFNFLYHASGPVLAQHAVRQAHREDLVGADGWIGWTPFITSYKQPSFSFQKS